MTGAMSLLCQLLLSFHPRPEIYVPRNTNCLASSTNIFLEPHACLTSTCSESGLSEAVEKPLDIYRVLPLFNVSSDSYVCMTPGCVKAAAEISANLDENVSACDDFYQFACGGWIDRHSIPDDSSSVSTHSKIVITLDSKLRSLLERELTGKEPDFIQMQKQLYDTCMDTSSIDEVGSTPLEDVLQNLGGWPVVEGEKWREDSFDWLDTVIEFRKRGYDFDVLMSFDVTQDYKNNTAHIIELDQPRLALSRNDFLSGLNSSVTEAYFKLMVKAANKLGANKDTSKAELREVLHFIALLANLTTPEEQRRDLDAMYHKYTVNQLAQEVPKALEMVRYIRTAFLNMLENLEWIEEGTKQRAKEKAEAMHLHIGFPKELLNDSYVSDLYKDLKFNTSESYFGMRRKLDIWETDESFSLLRKPSIKGLWKNYAMVVIVNAYYSFLENSMTFPAGVLQEPLYGNDRPKYLNFGSIGSIIGHEITHGFDDMGRQFDENGNNVRWGDDVTDQHFKTKVQCIIEQYGNYTTENGLQLNGINTQGENLADNGGMKAAFLAYKLWAKDHGSEPRLPGLNYTPNQLFWISLANVWCNKVRPEALRAEITQESHTPMRFRVPGALSNLPEFAEEFNCSSESAMVRKNRCHIW